MSEDTALLIRRLIAGDAEARAQIQTLAAAGDSPAVLVAAALVSDGSNGAGGDELLARASATATTTRDRQLVAIAAAYLAGNSDHLDALVRDHLADHPDSILAAWIASEHPRPSRPTTHPEEEPRMPELARPAPPAPPVRRPSRTIARWLVTFIGFPLGGLATDLVVGPVHSPVTALLGGLITGAILGAAQAWGLAGRLSPARWTAATAAGLTVGLVAATALVGYRTGLGDLVIQGAISGAAVGLAQALVLRPLFGPRAFAWPVVLGALWAAGWAITTAVGVQVEQRFSVFGAAGAVTVTALTAVLPVLVDRKTRRIA
jgi:hypothetical protein